MWLCPKQSQPLFFPFGLVLHKALQLNAGRIICLVTESSNCIVLKYFCNMHVPGLDLIIDLIIDPTRAHGIMDATYINKAGCV
ncbi:hypothetical protein BD779DRAFT_860907 [Infundibulicybe gibba]|nr:hypothetical protein BD779DRAFT_860907 [Infundibulicybe gibba]